MYWWRIRELRAALAAGTLGERARFLYLLLYVAITTSVIETLNVASPLTASEEAMPGRWHAIGSALYVGMTVAGTVWLYRVNGGRRGRGFLERYLALSWVFGLRFIAASSPVVVGIYAVGWRAGVATDDTGLFDVVLWTSWSALYWIGLARHFAKVVAAESGEVATA